MTESAAFHPANGQNRSVPEQRGFIAPADDDDADWAKWIFLAVALLIAGLQIIGPAIHSPLGIDEQVTYYLACGQTPVSLFARCIEQSATPPLYFWLARASMSVGEGVTKTRPAPEIWLRLPAVVSMLVAVVVVWLIGERYIEVGLGGPAALVFASHRMVFEYGMQARPYALAMLLSAAAVALTAHTRRRGWSIWLAVGIAVCCAAACWTHYLFAPVLPAVFLFAVILPRGRSPAGRPASLDFGANLRWIGGTILATLVLIAPLTTGLLRLFDGRRYLEWTTETASWQPIAELFVPQKLVLALAAGMVLAGMRLLWKMDSPEGPGFLAALSRRALVALVLWFVLPVCTLRAVGFWLHSSSLAQPRYLTVALAPVALITAWMFGFLAGQRYAWAVALVFVFSIRTHERIAELVRFPVVHDSIWKDAAALLNERADDGDLVLVQSGLAETILVPVRFNDPGFQEYCNSRLSDYYFKPNAVRLALPLLWHDGGWEREANYRGRIDATLKAGHKVWMIISADSDFGQNVETSALQWLTELGLKTELLNSDPVARVYAVVRPRSV